MGGAGKGKGKGYTAKGKGKGDAKGTSKGKGKGKGLAEKGKGKGKSAGAKSNWVEVKPLVLVTGAAGYVANSIVKRLLDRNYKVRGTVRSLADTDKVAPLKNLFPDLELVEADLLGGPEAFEKALEGVKFVIHTASPFKLQVTDPEKDLIEPAVKGTEAVVKAAIKAGVSKVVLTSSVAACGPPFEWMADPSKADNDRVWTEADWVAGDKPENSVQGYFLSKKKAEERAWELAKEAGLSLVAILPNFVLGPPLLPRSDGESVGFIRSMLDGTLKQKGCEGGVFGVVDVRDVSLAHLIALETDEADGKRFILSSERAYTSFELAKLLKDRFKAYPIPTEGADPNFQMKFDTSAAKKVLKFHPKPVDVTVKDMARVAIQLGIVGQKFLKRSVTHMKVSSIKPDSKGLDLFVKVVSKKESEPGPRGETVTDVVVGDETGVVTVQFFQEQLPLAEVGTELELRNAEVRMRKGFIKLQVSKWGKIAKATEPSDFTPNSKKDVSATEYALVST